MYSPVRKASCVQFSARIKGFKGRVRSMISLQHLKATGQPLKKRAHIVGRLHVYYIMKSLLHIKTTKHFHLSFAHAL